MQGLPRRGPRAARPTAGVAFVDDPKLVRGLDYYTRTTFEFVHAASARSPRSAAAAATTACPRSSAARRCPASAGRWAWTARCSRWRPRAVDAARRRPLRRVRGAARRRRPGERALRAGRHAAPGRDRRRLRLRRQGHQGRHEGRRPVRRAVRAGARRAGPRRERRSDQGHGDRGAGPVPSTDIVTDLQGEAVSDPHRTRRGTPPGVRRRHAPSRWPGGSPGGAITGASPSWTCATPRASCRSWSATSESVHDLRNEYCVVATGEVRVRPEGNENPDLPTGEIEVVVDTVEVLSPAAPLPFPIDEHKSSNINEEMRLKYRYLDIRREPMARGAAPALQGHQGHPRRHGGARLPRRRDPDPDPLHPRGRARLPGAGAPAARPPGTRCRSPRSCSSSC